MDAEDALRAQLYRLLSRLLAAPPDRRLLALIAGMTGDATALGRGITALAARAAEAAPEAVADEYTDLFIGVGRGELVPFASYYLTGFLNEKPLARLRGDMASLGIARADEVKEPEDHIAALCEMMAGLIEGAFGDARLARGPAALLRAPSGELGAAVLPGSRGRAGGRPVPAGRHRRQRVHGDRAGRVRDDRRMRRRRVRRAQRARQREVTP